MKNFIPKDALVSTLTLEQLQQAIAMQNQAMQPVKTEKTVIGVDEVCEITGYEKATIYAFTHKRQIPHYKRGKKLFFNRLEIETWLQENRIEPVSEFVNKVMSV